MHTVETLTGSLAFDFPPGPGWRALVPMLAATWVLTMGLIAPVVIWRLPSWNQPNLRRAALWMWAALVPTVVFALEYVVRALLRAPRDFLVVSIFAFFANVAAPFWVVKSLRAVGPRVRPASFQIARFACGLCWLGLWTLWLMAMSISCMTA